MVDKRIIARVKTHDGNHSWTIIQTKFGLFIRHIQHKGEKLILISKLPITESNLKGKTPSSQYDRQKILNST